MCLSAAADEAVQYSPARFADMDKPLPTLIKFPGAKKDGEENIYLYPNHGHDAGKYGTDYSTDAVTGALNSWRKMHVISLLSRPRDEISGCGSRRGHVPV
jgi:hypothetical protein